MEFYLFLTNVLQAVWLPAETPVFWCLSCTESLGAHSPALSSPSVVTSLTITWDMHKRNSSSLTPPTLVLLPWLTQCWTPGGGGFRSSEEERNSVGIHYESLRDGNLHLKEDVLSL